MTASQWQDWLNFNAIRMIGNEQYREELRHGQKMAQYANCHPYKGQTEPMRPIDFMNFVEKPEAKPQDLSSEAEQARIDREVFGL